jgi:hypothetical protein
MTSFRYTPGEQQPSLLFVFRGPFSARVEGSGARPRVSPVGTRAPVLNPDGDLYAVDATTAQRLVPSGAGSGYLAHASWAAAKQLALAYNTNESGAMSRLQFIEDRVPMSFKLGAVAKQAHFRG